MAEFHRQLDKAELHVHLEGSVDVETLCELDPKLTPEAARERYKYRDFAAFIEAYKWVMGYLRGPDEYGLVMRRLLDRLWKENVRYAEVNLSAGVIQVMGFNFEAIYDAVTRQAARSPVEVWFILDAVRQFGPDHGMEVAKLAVDHAGDRVVAFGIGGDEQRGPAAWFEEAFKFAKEHGLRVAAHAGETGGPESVSSAIRAGADRIGHGFQAAKDLELLRALRDRDIPLEICLSSNVATGAVSSLADHPVRRIYDAGVPIVLNTDDPAMFHTTLSREFELAEIESGFSQAELEQIAANGFRYAFRFTGGRHANG
jgi:adenosine deaminase/aminodeoxyfutalosine deaminase